MLHNPRSASNLSTIQPRPAMDPSLRLKTYGRIRPLDEDLTWWERLFRR